MAILFYELEHADFLINNNVEEITQRDLNILAKYWKSKGDSKSKIQSQLEKFCLDNDSYYNLIVNRLQIKRALAHSENYVMRYPSDIFINSDELAIIESINNYNYEKIIFVMLVCAKYFKSHSARKNTHTSNYSAELYNNQKIKDIIELSGIKMTRLEWRLAKHELTKTGIITPTIIDANKFALGIKTTVLDKIITVKDFRNIIAYYQQYKGDPMFICEECNTLNVKRGQNHKLCNDCAATRKRKMVKEYVKNYYWNNRC